MNLLINKIVNKLRKKKLTISIVESCTGGLLSSYLTSIPNVSEIYSMGLIAYSNKSKNSLLSIPKKILLSHGTVSRQTCILMVQNLNKLARTDISISTTGIAGPSGGTTKKPVGLIYVGIKIKKKIVCKKFLIKNKSRNFIQKETVKKTLRLLFNLVS